MWVVLRPCNKSSQFVVRPLSPNHLASVQHCLQPVHLATPAMHAADGTQQNAKREAGEWQAAHEQVPHEEEVAHEWQAAHEGRVLQPLHAVQSS